MLNLWSNIMLFAYIKLVAEAIISLLALNVFRGNLMFSFFLYWNIEQFVYIFECLQHPIFMLEAFAFSL